MSTPSSTLLLSRTRGGHAGHAQGLPVVHPRGVCRPRQRAVFAAGRRLTCPGNDGAFHIKSAMRRGASSLAAIKVNGNFPNNTCDYGPADDPGIHRAARREQRSVAGVDGLDRDHSSSHGGRDGSRCGASRPGCVPDAGHRSAAGRRLAITSRRCSTSRRLKSVRSAIRAMTRRRRLRRHAAVLGIRANRRVGRKRRGTRRRNRRNRHDVGSAGARAGRHRPRYAGGRCRRRQSSQARARAGSASWQPGSRRPADTGNRPG